MAVLRFRRETLRHRWSFALIVVVIGLTAGLATSAAAGARRSDAAYARFLEWSHDPELSFSGCDCTAEQLYDEFDRIRAQPFVAETTRVGFANVVVELPDGSRPSFLALLPAVDLDGRLGSELPRVKIRDGRLADPQRIDEVTVGFLAAERFRLELGDELKLRAANEHGPDVTTVRIVGIHVVPGELPSVSGPAGSAMLLTRSFANDFPDLVHPVNDSLLVQVRPDADPATVAAFIDTLQYHVDVDRSSEATAGIERTIGIETGALVLLAIVVGFVGIVVAGQMIRRHVDDAEVEALTWSALGWGREDTIRLAIVRGACFGAASSAIAVTIAIALSRLFPVGIARIADPDVGWHVDGGVLVAGGAVTVLTVLALTILATIGRSPTRSAANQGGLRSVTRAPSISSNPPVIVGIHFSRWGDGRSRTSLASLIVGVIAVTATAVAMSSVDHLSKRRDLAGATWDAAVMIFDPVGNPDVAQVIKDRYAQDALARVGAIPGVADVTPGGWLSNGWNGVELLVDGVAVETQIFGDDHSIRPAIRAGRAPSATGEVALGSETMRMIGVGIGDGVSLSTSRGGPSVSGRVVGEVVLASPYFTTFAPGDGAAIDASTARALGGSSDAATPVLLVKYDRDADGLETFNKVEAALGTDEAFEASDRQGATGLDRVRLIPVLLIAGLLSLVAAALGHLLLVSVGLHRRDLAVLSALGMTNRQTSASVVVHGSLVAGVACVIGVPLGVMAGRLTWDAIASYVIVVNRPVAPLALLGAIVGVLVVVALAVTYIPARRARHIRPATTLRAY